MSILNIDLYCDQSSSFIFICFSSFISNQGMHKSLDEFEFLSDLTTDFKVSCTLASEKYSFSRLSLSYIPRYVYYLHDTRTGKISWA